MGTSLKVNAPSVVAEIIDGEAVIMDLASGHYFSTQGVGAEIWRSVEAGLGRAGAVDALSHLYECDHGELQRAVDGFIAELVERRLVVELPTESVAPAQPPHQAEGTPRRAFVPPVLNEYSDMEDLLLLDPIHDVDEAGWPMPKAPEAKAS